MKPATSRPIRTPDSIAELLNDGEQLKWLAHAQPRHARTPMAYLMLAAGVLVILYGAYHLANYLVSYTVLKGSFLIAMLITPTRIWLLSAICLAVGGALIAQLPLTYRRFKRTLYGLSDTRAFFLDARPGRLLVVARTLSPDPVLAVERRGDTATLVFEVGRGNEEEVDAARFEAVAEAELAAALAILKNRRPTA